MNVDRHPPRGLDQESGLDRRTLLKVGLAVAVMGASGGALVSCTGGESRRNGAGVATGAASAPVIRQPTEAATSAVGGTPTALASSADVVDSGSALPASASPASTQSASTRSTSTETPAAVEPTPGSPAVEIVRGPASATGVALTFHGAGDVTLATRLLSELESAGARATVLAVGQWLDQEPAMGKRILAGGHELGNHTYRHLTMPPLTEVVDESEITRCAEVLRRLSGSAGRWFRPSGTVHATTAILEAAGRAGYATSLSYDVDPADYADPGAAAVTSRVLAAVRAGSIVSLHLGHLGTVQAMPGILDGLRSRGLAAVTMSDLMG